MDLIIIVAWQMVLCFNYLQTYRAYNKGAQHQFNYYYVRHNNIIFTRMSAYGRVVSDST